MAETASSGSVADRETLTGAAYALPEQAAPLQAIVDVGAVVSVLTWISWLFVVSAFPALSHARYFTVVVVETMNGEV
jgi:hypothetical protein